MAIATVPITDLGAVGNMDLQAAETALDATLGARIPNNGETYILLRNAGAGAHIVTVDTPRTVAGGLTVQNPPFTIAAGKWAALPPFDPAYFNNQSGANEGYLTVTSDGTQTEVKAVALRR